MHSRSFLHRLSETPRASAAEIDDIERHPLGFADVRANAQPVEDRPRRSIGFVTDSRAAVRHRDVVPSDACACESRGVPR